MGTFSVPNEQEFGAAARKEADRIQSDLEHIDEEIHRLDEERDAKRDARAGLAERLSILRKLFELDSSEGSAASDRFKTKPDWANPVDAAACDAAERYLREIGKHGVHFRGIANELLRDGVELRGRDPASTLVAYMVGDKQGRFCRPERRGVYALREFWPSLLRSVGEKNKRNGTTEA